MYLSNLGGGLSARYDRGAALADLEAAITAWKQSLETTPADSPDRPMRLSNLGNGLSARYARRGALADLEAAITAYRLAADATPSDSPARSMYLGNLGNGLRAYYAHGRMPADLEAAIAAYAEALETTPAASSDRPAMLTNLGAGLHARYALAADPADQQAAIDRYREACQTGLTIAPAVTLAAAKAWGDWAAKRDAWVEAAEAYGHGLAAIDRLYRSPAPAGRQAGLAVGRPGPRRPAAYALARTGDPAGAVLALERGRARLLTEAIERDRADLAEVATLDPAAYAAYEQATGELRALERQERAAETGYADPTTAVPADVLQERAGRARAALEAAIGRIQELPGHDAFGLPPSFDEVARGGRARPAAGRSPHHRRPAAWPSSSPWPTVRRPRRSRRSGRRTSRHGRSTSCWSRSATARSSAATWPASSASRSGSTPPWPMGCPGSARISSGPSPPGCASSARAPSCCCRRACSACCRSTPRRIRSMAKMRRLIDEFDVGHTPGARVLGAARAALAARERRAGGSRRGGRPAAPSVSAGLRPGRARGGRPLLPGRRQSPAVRDRRDRAGASRAAARAPATSTSPATARSTPRTHSTRPSSSPAPTPSEPAGDDGRLRLEEILANDWFGNSRLVVLSACQTAVIDARRLPDEAIGLPAGLLQAGVPAVIGTLWSVDDLSTTLLMSRFYAYHRQGDPATGEGPLSPAAALRRAQAWLRSRHRRRAGGPPRRRPLSGRRRPPARVRPRRADQPALRRPLLLGALRGHRGVKHRGR